MQRPRPKYQVFISSTYKDLREEREQVTWAVLKERHIPVGMEAMPATDDRGWRTILRLIDQSDYYVLVIAGMYGTIDEETGLSWTHREYRYAREKGVPALVFVRQDENITKDKTDANESGRAALEQLINEVTEHHKVVFWREVDDLCQSVAHALSNHIKDDEDDGRARPGWFRGDQIPSTEALEEFARLSAENKRLKVQIEELGQRSNLKLSLRLQDGEQADGAVVEDRFALLDYFGADAGIAAIMSVTRPSSDVLRDYVDRRNRTTWFKPSLRNDSEVVTRNAIVDFRIRGVSGLIHVKESVPSGLHIPSAIPLWPTNPSEHSYVDGKRWVAGELRVRLRVRGVHPAAEERLVPLGLVLPEPEATVEISYTISTEEGFRFEGACEIHRCVLERQCVTWEDLKGDGD